MNVLPLHEYFEAEGAAGSFAERAARVALIAGEHADSVDINARFPVETLQALKAERLLGLMIPRDLGGEAATISGHREIVHTTLGMEFAEQPPFSPD